MERQPSVSETFQPHQWWRAIQHANLEPVTRALAAHDIISLREMYHNFFRDKCSAGLTGLPLARVEEGGCVSNNFKQLYLIDTLHRIDLWRRKTANRFALSDLTPPNVGNPFGVVIDGIFVRSGCEDQHYCAHRIIDLLGSAAAPVVAEIGGGFGGMAYYLLRDHPDVTYINFDLPETIALASYYLLSAFPDLKACLYGEADLSAETLRNFRIILMPSFSLPQMPANSVDVAFNARILSDLSSASLDDYLAEFARTTRGHLLHLNRTEGSLAADAWFNKNAPTLKLVSKQFSEWNNARTLYANEMEYLYSRALMAESPSAPGHRPS
ncbi:MAG TPA: putative sugar O-methyltransferase [Bryobacteraceae bacterium]|nr:putative sugar O-methyltransferase [Bryobacteraceae bacterium]